MNPLIPLAALKFRRTEAEIVEPRELYGDRLIKNLRRAVRHLFATYLCCVVALAQLVTHGDYFAAAIGALWLAFPMWTLYRVLRFGWRKG